MYGRYTNTSSHPSIQHGVRDIGNLQQQPLSPLQLQVSLLGWFLQPSLCAIGWCCDWA